MKARTNVIAAVVGAAALVSGTSIARAEEPAASLPPPPSQSVDVIDTARFFTRGAQLGDAWARALGAVLEGMRRAVEEERLAAHKVVTTPPPVLRRAATPALRFALPFVVRDVMATAPVQPTPVPILPVTESLGDVRGERALLLGARVELPWMVP